MAKQSFEYMLYDKHGYYTEEELKQNWINTDKLEEIMIQLSRQALYQANIIYTQDGKINTLLKQNSKGD